MISEDFLVPDEPVQAAYFPNDTLDRKMYFVGKSEVFRVKRSATSSLTELAEVISYPKFRNIAGWASTLSLPLNSTVTSHGWWRLPPNCSVSIIRYSRTILTSFLKQRYKWSRYIGNILGGVSSDNLLRRGF